MSGASHVAIAGEADQEKINPTTGESGTAPEQERPAVEQEQPVAVAKEVKTEGTFLGLNGRDWMIGGIGVGIGAAVVGTAWALCSGD